jgi:hypothetical protein
MHKLCPALPASTGRKVEIDERASIGRSPKRAAGQLNENPDGIAELAPASIQELALFIG